MISLLKGCLWAMARVLGLLPYGLVTRFGATLGEGVYWLLPFRRDLVFENLRLAYAGSLDEAALIRLARANYRHYGRILLDTLVSLGWSRENYRRHVRIEGAEAFRAALEKHKGAFLVTFHLGSWELLMGAAAAHDVPVDVIVKRAVNPRADELLAWTRKVRGLPFSYERGAHQQVLKAFASGRAAGYILDQFMGPPIGVPVTFFGKEAGTSAYVSVMLERRHVPVFLCYCRREPSGGHVFTIEPGPDLRVIEGDRHARLYERTQRMNDAIEQVIRRYPEQWLWLHRRWKPFRGEPRWKRAPVAALTALAVALLFGCASPKPEETGITLPPDPTISLPQFSSSADDAKAIEHAQSVGIAEPPKNAPKASKKRRVDRAGTSSVPTFSLIERSKLPFMVGERMEIDLNWMALPAGRVIMEVRSSAPINGRETFELWGNVLSSRLVDAIYHVDNTIESFIDSKATLPYKFLLHMVETSQKKETRVAFDHSKGKAFYWSKRISQKWGDELIDVADSLTPGAMDMFSGVYHLRLIDYELNKPVRFPVYEKSKNLQVVVTPVANELVTSKVGVFQCWKLSVQVELNNNLQQMGESHLWLSDDSKRYIVKFDAKVKIGSLKGNLVDLKER